MYDGHGQASCRSDFALTFRSRQYCTQYVGTLVIGPCRSTSASLECQFVQYQGTAVRAVLTASSALVCLPSKGTGACITCVGAVPARLACSGTASRGGVRDEGSCRSDP